MLALDRNREVLVVDDDPDLLYLAQKVLKKAGYTPLPAGNGVEALRQMVTHPDCRRMVTDFKMPVLGSDAWIRVLERFCSEWSIVVISSDDVDPGPFPLVPKPVDFSNLLTWFEPRAS
jgi:CheY-like chemotaxis protein